MGFLRRLFGTGTGTGTEGENAPPPTADPSQIDAEERARELELARFDQDRTDDLVRRQQRFSSYSWTPPAQGGERRAEDSDGGSSG